MITSLPAIPDAKSVSLEQAAAFATQIVAWAETTDDLEALDEARAKVSAIETYLRRRHEGAASEIGRAARKLDLRVAELLEPAKKGRPPKAPRDRDGSSRGMSHAWDIPKNDRHRLRKIAEHKDEPAVAEAIENGASRAEVLRQARQVEQAAAQAEADAEQAKQTAWLKKNVAAPSDPEGDRFRADVGASINDVRDAADSLSRWTIDDVRRALETESPYLRQTMTDRLADSLTTLAKYAEVTE